MDAKVYYKVLLGYYQQGIYGSPYQRYGIVNLNILGMQEMKTGDNAYCADDPGASLRVRMGASIFLGCSSRRFSKEI